MHRQLPDFEPCVYRPQRIAAIVATLADDGIEPERALQGAGIEPAQLRSTSTRVSYAQLGTVCRNALRLARDPTIALRSGARMHVTAYDIWGYALLSSRSFGEMLEFSAKYRRVIGPMSAMNYDVVGAPSSCFFEPLLTPDPLDDLYRFAIEFTYAAHQTLGRDLYSEAFAFSSISVAYAEPAHAEAFRAFFGCPVTFGANANALHFDPGWSVREPSTHDPLTHAMARQMCQQFLADLSHAGGTAARVRLALFEQLPWRLPDLESMARELGMDPRTLRRRLQTQGTSYRELLGQVRRVLALHYLRKTRMTTEEIASRLGYSDAANLRHAFARWTGKSPSAYRRDAPPSSASADRSRGMHS